MQRIYWRSFISTYESYWLILNFVWVASFAVNYWRGACIICTIYTHHSLYLDMELYICLFMKVGTVHTIIHIQVKSFIHQNSEKLWSHNFMAWTDSDLKKDQSFPVFNYPVSESLSQFLKELLFKLACTGIHNKVDSECRHDNRSSETKKLKWSEAWTGGY